MNSTDYDEKKFSKDSHGNLIPREKDSNFCPDCGQHFAAHNDDGSCVQD